MKSRINHQHLISAMLFCLLGYSVPSLAVIASNISTDTHFTSSINLADVDNDGDLDLIAGNANQPNRLYLNDGHGVLGDDLGGTAGSNIGSDSQATLSTSLGDVDNDGDLDLIVGNYEQANRLYLNDGNGVFGDGLGGNTGSNIGPATHRTRDTILGDVDGDGDLDLITAHSEANGVNRLYLNDGHGVFGDGLGGSTGSDIGTDNYDSYAASLGDVDGDGDLDLVVGNPNQPNRLYLNNGSGVFGDGLGGTTGSDISTDSHTTFSIYLGDVDNDGDLDLIVGNYNQVNRLYLNDGNGVFGDGLGGTTGSDISTDTHPTRDINLGDVDNDNDLDLVVGNDGQVNRLYLNNGHGVFGDGLGGTTGSEISSDSHNTYDTSLGDVDGDGNLDLVVGNNSQVNRLYLNNGNSFTNGLGVSSGSDISNDSHLTESTTLGDVDGDGDLDMVVGNTDQVNRLYLNDGHGVFGDGVGGSTGSDISSDVQITYATSLGDVDGDGDIDLVTGNYQVNRLYLNDGNGVFGDGTGGTSGRNISSDTHYTFAITLGDVDGDGDLDLVVGNYSQANRLYLNDGNGVFGDGTGGTTGSNISTNTHNTIATHLGDVDGDGDIDLVTGNYNQVNRLYLNDGNGVFGDGAGGTTGSDIGSDTHATSTISLGDVDGDGDLDLIVGNYGQTNRLYLNDGHGIFGDGTGGTIGSDISSDVQITYTSSLGDIDGDGDLDLIVGNEAQVNRLYINDGNGVFGDGLGSTTGSNISTDTRWTHSTTLGDVDGDGDLDLIVGNRDQLNRLYLNQAKQLHLRVWSAEAITGITRLESTTPVVDISISCIGSSSVAASLDYSFEYGTALTPDFFPYLTSGTLTWADGQCSTKTIPLPIFNDDVYEGTESLTLILNNPVGLYNSDPLSQTKKYRITILDDDADSDGDGVIDSLDAFPNDYSEWLDTDGDGIGNNTDTDDDGDGVDDTNDYDPLDATITSEPDCDCDSGSIGLWTLLLLLPALLLRRNSEDAIA